MASTTPLPVSSRHPTEEGRFNAMWPDEVTKNEPMFFSCSLAYAHEHGGPITRAFVEGLWEAVPSLVGDSTAILDSRVHMLMPGWCPAIPGYHHDDVARGGADNQPDYDEWRKQPFMVEGNYSPMRTMHYMGMVNAHLAPTRFAVGDVVMPAVEPGQTIYRVWHDEVEAMLADGRMAPVDVKSGIVYGFRDEDFHTAVPAVAGGWRWFVRVTVNSQRVISNEIRRQVQVYLPVPTQGW